MLHSGKNVAKFNYACHNEKFHKPWLPYRIYRCSDKLDYVSHTNKKLFTTK